MEEIEKLGAESNRQQDGEYLVEVVYILKKEHWVILNGDEARLRYLAL